MLHNDFIPGLALSERFFLEAVKPILAQHFPDLIVSAALLGPGSEVSGFDTPQSMDHDWGPRVMLFLSNDDFPLYQAALEQVLRRELPRTFLGFPIDMAYHTHRQPWETEEARVVDDRFLQGGLPEPAFEHHRVSVFTVRQFFRDSINVEIHHEITPLDWILIPQQQLLSVTSGKVFADPSGELEAARLRLAYYPQDVLLYLLAAQWMRISQEESFMGRCGQVGDELGSRLVAGRLVHDLMRLGFLMERKYAPYLKWFGTAFQKLACAARFSRLFEQILSAEDWRKRQIPLAEAFELAASLHNALGITERLPEEAIWFYERPFRVIGGERFADAIRRQITDPQVLALPKHLGGVDQFIDSTDAVNYLNQSIDRLKMFFSNL